MATLLLSAALPRFVVFKSLDPNKYLKVQNDTDESVPAGFVKFDGEDMVDPKAKFELEWENSNTGGNPKELVSIRSCYNNKYLMTNLAGPGNTHWIVAAADKPEEDQSKPTCTLFKFEENNSKQFAIRHVQMGLIGICWWSVDTKLYGGMYLGGDSPDSDGCLYTLENWDNLLVFPKRVAFKDGDGNYLNATWFQGLPYQQFDGKNINERVEYEVTPVGNGCIRIKSLYHGKYWRRSPNWIWSDCSDASSKDPDVMFWPVKIKDNVVALRNMGNNYFCAGLTTEGKTNCLNADTPSIATNAELVVEELVVSRKIYNLEYLVSNARIYGESVILVTTETVVNESYGTETKTLKLGMTYADIKTTNWNNSVSFKFGVEASLQVAFIPFIFEGKVAISAEFDYKHEWGGSETTETTVQTSYSVTVPPRTTTHVSLIATKAFCDVPFSYTQSDILSNGENVITSFQDGVFKGSNYFDFKYEEKQTKM